MAEMMSLLYALTHHVQRDSSPQKTIDDVLGILPVVINQVSQTTSDLPLLPL
ncbi:hypothetical protein KR100_07090 [Synechococcus sp. KORDI-100]|nr:hypothetical protein KR100_07090 [Synechococcus sp. KORDI-100]